VCSSRPSGMTTTGSRWCVFVCWRSPICRSIPILFFFFFHGVPCVSSACPWNFFFCHDPHGS
jgi:hypothetical protein